MQLKIIAVGSTGWVAQEIADDLADALSGRTKAFKKAFAIANDPNVDIASTVKATMTMVNEYRDH
jgi:archaellum component FlaG (FlaF/FlaG flagellin family)